MIKTYTILFLLFIYIIFYKIYFIFQGEIIIYIINPIVWVIFLVISYIFFSSKRKLKKNRNSQITMIMICISLLYVIIYYALGIVVGYTNNPYSVSIDGIIINFFSIGLVLAIKEYIRYLFVNININRGKKIYYFLVFIVFLLIDINILNILKIKDILTMLSEELIIPLIQNILMMYICYVGSPFSAVLSSFILLVPSLIFNAVPDYEWYIIMIFNILYCVVSYFILQYIINKTIKNIPVRLLDNRNISRMVFILVLILMAISFSGGFLPIRSVAILTGSMRPVINPGDMVIIAESKIEDVKRGDIIEFKSGNYKIIHRVISIYYKNGQISLITKGDANKKPDKMVVTKNEFSGKVKYRIPYIGYPAYWLRNIVNNNNEVNIK